MNRKCCDCNKIKSIKLFRKQGKKHSYICLKCNVKRVVSWQKANSERKRKYDKKRDLKRLYNLSLSEFNSLKRKQNNECAICGDKEKLCVDHDHKTGKVRGLLCHKCNRGLGYFKDDPFVLHEATEYLRYI